METCVLIPREFSLVLTSDQSSCRNLFKNDSGTLVADVRISVWSNVFIPSGTLIYPFQGSIRFDKIDLYSLLDDNDVSTNARTRVLQPVSSISQHFTLSAYLIFFFSRDVFFYIDSRLIRAAAA